MTIVKTLTERELFTTPQGTENGLPTLNTDALYVIGNWVANDQAAMERVVAWSTRVPDWQQETWGMDDGLKGMPSAGEWAGALDVLNPTCGAAFCAAGNTIAYSSEFRLNYKHGNTQQAIPIKATGQFDDKGRMIYADSGDPINTPDAAQQILGLTGNEADDFFSEENTAEYMRARINGFCDDRDLPHLFPDAGSTDQRFYDSEFCDDTED